MRIERKTYGAGYGIAAMEQELLQERMVKTAAEPAAGPAGISPGKEAKGWWPDPLDRDVMIALLLRKHPQAAEEVAKGLAWRSGTSPQKVEASLKRLRSRGLLMKRGDQYGVVKGLTVFTRGGGRISHEDVVRATDRLLAESGAYK